MIVSLFHVTVPSEATEPFERSWRQRAGKVDAMPGFRGLEVLRAGETPGAYIVLTRWETRADFDRWASSPEFVAGHARTGDSGAAGVVVEFYEVLPSYAGARGIVEALCLPTPCSRKEDSCRLPAPTRFSR